MQGWINVHRLCNKRLILIYYNHMPSYSFFFLLLFISKIIALQFEKNYFSIFPLVFLTILFFLKFSRQIRNPHLTTFSQFSSINNIFFFTLNYWKSRKKKGKFSRHTSTLGESFHGFYQPSHDLRQTFVDCDDCCVYCFNVCVSLFVLTSTIENLFFWISLRSAHDSGVCYE